MTEWQDISTAPKDVLVLVHQPGNMGKWFKTVFCAVQVTDDKWWSNGVGHRPVYKEMLDPLPTHWMPLPLPPKDT